MGVRDQLSHSGGTGAFHLIHGQQPLWRWPEVGVGSCLVSLSRAPSMRAVSHTQSSQYQTWHLSFLSYDITSSPGSVTFTTACPPLMEASLHQAGSTRPNPDDWHSYL